MKGLIFNLLDNMARQSGCADEAWDLVMEFVASETEHAGMNDTCLSCFSLESGSLFSLDSEDGMVPYFGNDSGYGECVSEFPDMLELELEDGSLDSIPALVDPDLASHSMAAPCPEGFSHDLLSLLEQLLAEALTGEAEAEEYEDLEDGAFLGWNPPRGSSS